MLNEIHLMHRCLALPCSKSIKNKGSVISASLSTRWSTSLKSSYPAVKKEPPATIFVPDFLQLVMISCSDILIRFFI